MRRILAIMALASIVLGMTSGLAVAEDTQEGWATAANGGGMEIDTTAYKLDWGVPASASSYNLRLEWIPENMHYLPLPLRGGWIGTPFSLRTWDYDGSGLVTTSKPMTLVFHYEKGDLMGLPESSLQIVQQIDVLWSALPAVLDTTNKTISTTVNGSGTFGLLVGTGAHGGANTVFAGSGAIANSPIPAPAAAPAPESAPAPAPAGGMNSFIAGRLYFDTDANGQMANSDAPVGGATVRISSGNWSATTTTAPDGTYVFYSLQDGTYSVEVVVGPEWDFTSGQRADGIRVNGQSTSIGIVNFGMRFR